MSQLSTPSAPDDLALVEQTMRSETPVSGRAVMEYYAQTGHGKKGIEGGTPADNTSPTPCWPSLPASSPYLPYPSTNCPFFRTTIFKSMHIPNNSMAMS